MSGQAYVDRSRRCYDNPSPQKVVRLHSPHPWFVDRLAGLPHCLPVNIVNYSLPIQGRLGYSPVSTIRAWSYQIARPITSQPGRGSTGRADLVRPAPGLLQPAALTAWPSHNKPALGLTRQKVANIIGGQLEPGQKGLRGDPGAMGSHDDIGDFKERIVGRDRFG